MIHITPEVSDGENRGYLMYDSGATEIEVAEYLHGFVKLTKPQRILSTGIYTGISDMYMAEALKENGYGQITALEINEFHLNRARELWKLTEVSDYISSILIKSLDFQPEGIYDLLVLDSELNLRLHETVKYFHHLRDGGYILIHDFPRNWCKDNFNPDHPEILNWPVDIFPPEISAWIKEDKLRVTSFNNPRGMIMLYKVHPDDLKF